MTIYKKDLDTSAINKFRYNKQLHCLFLGNPYCSDDAVGYYLYNDLKDKNIINLSVFYSYNIEVEDIIISLSKLSNSTVIIIDSIIGDNLIFKENIKFDHQSTHKAEWSIISSYCIINNIPMAILLIPITNTIYTGEIEKLSTKTQLLREYIYELITIEDEIIE